MEKNNIKTYPNLIIIAGTGRNVGKTHTVCRIIEKMSALHETMAVKISPHFHTLEGSYRFLFQSDSLIVAEEQNISRKDSSRMLQSGAKKAWYIQANNNTLLEGMEMIFAESQGKPIIVESGGLYSHVEPGILVYVRGDTVKHEPVIRSNTVIMTVDQHMTDDFNIDMLHFENGKFTIDD